MGQCYSVTANLSFQHFDPSGFCKAIKDYVDEHDNKTCHFRKVENMNWDDPFECFKFVCPEAEKRYDHYVACFSSSYGWGSVMTEVFMKALEHCCNRSEVIIAPWEEGECTIVHKVLGKVREDVIGSDEQRIANWMIREGTENTTHGEWTISYKEIAEQFDLKEILVEAMADKIYDALLDRDEIESVEQYDNQFSMFFYTDYCASECLTAEYGFVYKKGDDEYGDYYEEDDEE